MQYYTSGKYTDYVQLYVQFFFLSLPTLNNGPRLYPAAAVTATFVLPYIIVNISLFCFDSIVKSHKCLVRIVYVHKCLYAVCFPKKKTGIRES